MIIDFLFGLLNHSKCQSSRTRSRIRYLQNAIRIANVRTWTHLPYSLLPALSLISIPIPFAFIRIIHIFIEISLRFAFSQECPEGVVHEDCFKDIYAKFFPHGSKYLSVFFCVLAGIIWAFFIAAHHKAPLKPTFRLCYMRQFFGAPYLTPFRLTKLFLFSSDSSLYAHYVFKAFDVNCNGAISFRVIISLYKS